MSAKALLFGMFAVAALVGYCSPTRQPAAPVTFAQFPPAQPELAPQPRMRLAAVEPAAIPIDEVPLPPSRPPRGEPSKVRENIELGLTAAAIAAIIVQASRQAYYASGRPCACPDDTMRNGRRCGSRSAYSRPGGAAPLCYPSDVPAGMIEEYRRREAQRAKTRSVRQNR